MQCTKLYQKYLTESKYVSVVKYCPNNWPQFIRLNLFIYAIHLIIFYKFNITDVLGESENKWVLRSLEIVTWPGNSWQRFMQNTASQVTTCRIHSNLKLLFIFLISHLNNEIHLVIKLLSFSKTFMINLLLWLSTLNYVIPCWDYCIYCFP